MNIIRCFCLLCFLCAGTVLPTASAQTDAPPALAQKQTIYVPAYSHIYIGDRERPFLLTITLSVRNIDPKHRITLSTVDFYESQGKLVKKYLGAPVTLNPLESVRYIVPESDRAGGSGANFLVDWHSDTPVNAPIVESIMIGTQSQQGISFTSRGQVLNTSN